MQFCFAPPGMRVKLRGSVASAEGAAERTAVPGSAGVPPAQFNTCTDGLSRTVRDGSGDPSSHAKAREPARRRRSQEKRLFSALQMSPLSLTRMPAGAKQDCILLLSEIACVALSGLSKSIHSSPRVPLPLHPGLCCPALSGLTLHCNSELMCAIAGMTKLTPRGAALAWLPTACLLPIMRRGPSG